MKSRIHEIIYSLKILLICTLFTLLILLLCLLFEHLNLATDLKVMNENNGVKVIIDAGHGGRDGGAVSKSNLLEKDLNLSVSTTLNDILMLCGVNCLMTREDDRLVCDENDPALKGKLKLTDLKNRLEIAKANPEAVFISIHMNTFPIEKYSGLQVYYSPNNDASFEIANAIQDNVRLLLQPDNNRKVKKAGSSIYLLNRITSPAILIECGFLSNTAEAERLSKAEYRTALSLVFAQVAISKTNKGENL